VRLEELRLIAYGPFTNCTLQLQPGLNVLYGPNEAGKSSALRAMHAMLFGFKRNTRDNFIHHYRELRVGGVFVDASDRRLECVRRKQGATLRDGDDDQPIDEGLLRAILGEVNADLFASVFGIDHKTLREGGDAVLRGEGNLGELLFAAGGTTHLREKQQSLDEAASALFKPGGRNPPINTTLRGLKELDEKIRDLQRSPEKWAQHDAEHRRLVEQEEKIRADLADTESARSRLDRYHKALGFIGTWKQKRSDLDALADVVALSDDADDRFREANQKRTIAEADKKKATGRVEELQTELDKLDVPTTLLGEESRIDDLYRRLGSHETGAADSTVLAGQQRTARDSAKRTIEKLGWELSLDEAADRRIAEEKKARVRALATRHGEVTQGKNRQQQTLGRLRKQLGELNDHLAGEAKIEEPTSLKEAISAATPALDVEYHLPEQRDEVDRLKREASDALARLPLWSGSIEDVCRLEVPSEETVDQFDQTSRDLASEISQLTEQYEMNETKREQASQNLAALELTKSVPTEEKLLIRREIRDQGVQLAVRQLTGEELPAGETDNFVSRVGDGTDLASSLQPSVRQADDLADRLRRESDRVANRSQFIAQLQEFDKDLQRLNKKLSSTAQQQSDCDADWRKRWETSGIVPATPAEMRGWLRQHAQLVKLSGELELASQQLARDEHRVASLCATLTSELSQQEVEGSGDASLQQLVQAAQKRVDETTAAERDRENLAVEVKRLSDEVAQAEDDLAVAEQEFGVWLADWKEALQPLGLEDDALPEQAEAVLANLDELFRNLDEAKGYRNRIWGIEQLAKEFTQAAIDMAKMVAPDLTDCPVGELVAMLNRRLNDAKQVRQQATLLQDQLKEETNEFEKADSDLADSTAVLDAMVTEAACTGVAELPSAIEKSQRKKSLEGELAQLETQLAPLCAGQPLPEFVEAAQCEDADRLPSRIEEFEAQIASLQGELEETIAAKERESVALGQFDASADATEKAGERQSLLVSLEDDAREYVVTTVASRLLQRAVETYKEKTQGPVLAGASTYFQKLTCGSFGGLKTDYDESGQDVLVGVRPDKSTLPVEAMSDGSRDQLYLALRLGTLDHWFDHHEPIPFVVDDILLTFDDARATATLEVLAGMSSRNQVLFFTHHEHLVELARKACPSVHVVKEWDA